MFAISPTSSSPSLLRKTIDKPSGTPGLQSAHLSPKTTSRRRLQPSTCKDWHHWRSDSSPVHARSYKLFLWDWTNRGRYICTKSSFWIFSWVCPLALSLCSPACSVQMYWNVTFFQWTGFWVVGLNAFCRLKLIKVSHLFRTRYTIFLTIWFVPVHEGKKQQNSCSEGHEFGFN